MTSPSSLRPEALRLAIVLYIAAGYAALGCDARMLLGTYGQTTTNQAGASGGDGEPGDTRSPTSQDSGLADSGGTTTLPPELDSGLADGGGPTTAPPEVDAGPEDGSVPAAALLQCGATGEVGAFGVAGETFGPTETSTDWIWSGPMPSLALPLLIESELTEEGPDVGYYYQTLFAFEAGVAGRLGLQAAGGYQSDPPSSPTEFTKMAVFWLSGPPLAAQLGDIAYPDARIAAVDAAGASWLTIHARVPWVACHLYELRFAPGETDTTGNRWYSASVADLSEGTELTLGRMLLPADVGALTPFTTSRTSPIDFGEYSACGVVSPTSVVYGIPSTIDFDTQASDHANRFASPQRCDTSRFSELAGGVRHELGLHRL